MRRAMIAGLLVVMGPLSVLGQYYSGAATINDNRPKILVTGESVVYVQPDKIIVSLGIETWDSSIVAAKQKNDDIMKKTIAAIEKCGIRKKAIQTDSLSIQPTYKDVNWPRYGTIEGYVVQNALIVTLTNVSKVEGMISSALEAGVTHIHNVDFQTTELRKYRDQARHLALEAAREKARDMASVYDQTVGKPLQINENQSYGGYYWSWNGWGSRGRNQTMSQNSFVNAPSASEEELDTLALGKIGIRANVQVTFELKDK